MKTLELIDKLGDNQLNAGDIMKGYFIQAARRLKT